MTHPRFRLRATGVLLSMGLVATGCFNGNERSEPPPDPTPEPSLESAVWEGTWEFNYTLIRLIGATEEETSSRPGQTIRRIWVVTPGCDDRPCDSEISATNPDEPEAGEATSAVFYEDGIYKVEQTFPPEVTNSCLADDQTIIPDAFEATNTVEVTPTDFEVQEGRAVVTAMTAIKLTAFIPKGPAETAGGTCERKAAEWEASVVPVQS